jgi:hypothetical protein
MCIRYHGTEGLIELDLIDANSGIVCDNLPPALQQQADEQEADRKRFMAEWQVV